MDVDIDLTHCLTTVVVWTCLCANPLTDLSEAIQGLCWTHCWTVGLWPKQDRMYLIPLVSVTRHMLWCIRHESLEEDGLLLHFTPWLCIACLTGQKCPTLSAINLFLGNWPGWNNHWVGQFSEASTGVWRCESSQIAYWEHQNVVKLCLIATSWLEISNNGNKLGHM